MRALSYILALAGLAAVLVYSGQKTSINGNQSLVLSDENWDDSMSYGTSF